MVSRAGGQEQQQQQEEDDDMQMIWRDERREKIERTKDSAHVRHTEVHNNQNKDEAKKRYKEKQWREQSIAGSLRCTRQQYVLELPNITQVNHT